MNSVKYWIGKLFKYLSLTVALLSGIVGIGGQIISTFSENPSQAFQRNVFWLTLNISCFFAAVLSWLFEHKRVRQLEIELASMYSQLKIELNQILLVPESSENTFRIDIYVLLTNTKKERNSIISSGFSIDLLDKKIEGKSRRHKNVRPSLEQGKPENYFDSFSFESLNKAEKEKALNILIGKEYVLRLIDSYGQIHELAGIISENIKKKTSERRKTINIEKSNFISKYLDDW